MLNSANPEDQLRPEHLKLRLRDVWGKQTGWTVLHLLAWYGKEKAVEAACRLGAEPDTMDRTLYLDAGNTAMHIAAISGHAAVVKVLLHHQASCRVRNHHGQLPLDLVNKESSEIVLMEMLAQEEDPSGSVDNLLPDRKKSSKNYAKIVPL